MYVILGLNEDDKMTLYHQLPNKPSEDWLEGAAEVAHFKQLLVINADARGTSQVARYTYRASPMLEEVQLV